MIGMKQNVNHSLGYCVSVDKAGKAYSEHGFGGDRPVKGGDRIWMVRGIKMRTYQRFITRPEKLPQFWHCTVMCSAPLSCDWKAGLLLAMRAGKCDCNGHTVRSAREEKEHGVPLLCAAIATIGAAEGLGRGRSSGGGAEVERRWRAMRELWVGEARVL